MSPTKRDPSAIGSGLEDAPRPGQGRRPTAEVRAAILQAAGRLLLAEGMGAFTIERVAAVAGASKMTIYKMWPSKGALALAGYFATVEPTLAFPDTGDIEADLTAQLTAFVQLLRDTNAGPVIAGLIGQAQTDPDLATAYQQQYSQPRRTAAVKAISCAQTRGQIQPTADPEILVDQLWGACYHRLLLPDQPLTEQFAEDLVHNLFHGVRVTTANSAQPPAEHTGSGRP
jgi:AcrR family transcriptional regulator